MHTTFTKYEGAGNDFIMIDDRDSHFTPGKELIAHLCDRHRGVGADGVIILRRSAELDCSMRYFNADGSEGEMCGNGARCFTLFAEHLGIGGETKYFDAMDGVHKALVCGTKGHLGEIQVGMIDVQQIQKGERWWFLNTGVPHYVEFVDDVATIDVVGRGRAIRRDTVRFPQGTNVNFVQILGHGELQMRTYERGVEDETLACGTGTTAAAIVANFAHQTDASAYHVLVPGGELFVGFDHQPGTQTYTGIHLTGPARRVFEGTFDTNDF